LKLRLDFHVHTNFSPDGNIKLEELESRAKMAGLDGLAITDHDTMEGAYRAREMCNEIIIIPGMEIETRHGHLLAINPERSIKLGLTFAETVSEIHDAKGLAILAHPFSLVKSGHDLSVLSANDLDAIEAANASSFPYRRCLRKGMALAQKLSLPVTGGSDAHIPQLIGRAYTIVESEGETVNGVLNAIREGQTEIGGSGVRIGEWAAKLLTGLARGLRV